MSWEETSSMDYPCCCGKGNYTEIIEMDDWNRMRKSRVMHCSECAEKEMAEKARVKEERERLGKMEKKIKTYFEDHYINEWLSYFATAKNKKMVWTLAKELGVESGSLSSFYNRKYPTMEKYITSLATYYYMDKIMHVLNINDGELASMVEEAMRLRKAENTRAINQWYVNH